MRWLALLPLLSAPATWSFDKDELDREPAGFEFASSAETPAGTWRVVKDGENRVLAQLDAQKVNKRFATAVVKESSYKDVRASVRGKPVSGKEDQAVGLVWRWQDARNYYVVRSNVLEENVRLYRVVNGNRIKFAGKEDVKLKTGAWHTLAVEHRGSDIAVYLGDRKLFEATDETFTGAGRVGVWIKADSVTYFDDLSAEELK
jgi:hypothetical protein